MSVPAERLASAPRLPTEDELPCDDGIPMETPRHRLQMELLIHTLEPWAAKRRDVFVSGNQFLYFSADPKTASEPLASALCQRRQSANFIPSPAHSIRQQALTTTPRMEQVP